MKKKNLITAALGIFSAAALVLAGCGSSEEPPAPEESEMPDEPVIQDTLPDSILYYGEVTELGTDEEGNTVRLFMDSQADGELIVNVSDKTFWVDSGNWAASEPSEIKEGDRIYVFHSPVMTMSLPPQTAGFAVVGNVPADVRCAMYHEIEKVTVSGGTAMIETDNGTMQIAADEDTLITDYSGNERELSDIKEGGFMLVIYDEEADAAPENPGAFKIMLLPA